MPERVSMMAVCGCGAPVELLVCISTGLPKVAPPRQALSDHQQATGCRSGDLLALHVVPGVVRLAGA
jgi:hypothetical protein